MVWFIGFGVTICEILKVDILKKKKKTAEDSHFANDIQEPNNS